MKALNQVLRKRIKRINRRRLKNRTPSVIASNCNGACICNDLGLRFNSPFVNLWIKPKDFIKLLTDLENYLNSPIEFIKEDGISYPVGKLKDILIFFQHYKTESDALSKWEERKKRINYNNLYIIFTDRDGCTYEDLVDFDNLPYSHKVAFCNKPYPELKSTFYIKGFENESSVGMCMDLMNSFSGKKYYDQFNYVKWFNS